MTHTLTKAEMAGLRGLNIAIMTILLASPWVQAEDLIEADQMLQNTKLESANVDGNRSGAGAIFDTAAKTDKPFIKITKSRWSPDRQRLTVTVRWNKKAVVKSGVRAKGVNLVAIGPEGVTTIPFELMGPYRSRIRLNAEQVRVVQKASALAVAATQKHNPAPGAQHYNQAYVYVAYIRGGPNQSVSNCSNKVITANTDLSGCLLTGADLGGMKLVNTNFRGAYLAGSRFGEVPKNQGRVTALAASNPPDCYNPDDGTDCSNRSDLTGADFSNASLVQAWFGNSTLNNANFSNAIITAADFTNAKLQGAKFNRANGQGSATTNWFVNFSHADLTGADLSQTNLFYAQFDHANLSNATLHQTNMTCTSVSNMNVNGAHLNGTNFSLAEYFGDLLFPTQASWAPYHPSSSILIETTCPSGSPATSNGCIGSAIKYNQDDFTQICQNS